MAGFWLNSVAGLSLDMWKTVSSANITVFGSRVTSVTLGIPNIDEGLLLSATFDGSSITPGDWGSWSGVNIGLVATIINGLYLDS